jgi:hypothetical protein
VIDIAGARRVLFSTWHLWAAPVAVGIFAIPFAAVLAHAIAARRQRAGVDPGWALRSAFAEVFMIVGTAPWVWLILTPERFHARGKNLVPFRDLQNQIHIGYAYAAMQIGGNLLVFAALGFLLPVRFRTRPWVSLLVGAIFSATVEALQWYLRLGRYTSVDDVIVNATGAYLAAWLSFPWWRRRIGTGLPTKSRIPVPEPDGAVTSG